MASDPTPDHADAVAAISDPARRARVATRVLGEHQTAVTELARIRRQAVAELRDQGLSYAQVGAAIGVTRGRIAQLRGPDATTEAAFFGGRRITIATPLRQSDGGRVMVAQEDADAATVLAERLAALDLETTSARISPGGPLDLTPDALVVICGPKTSPHVADLIAQDPALSFEERDDGRWTIRERDSGTEFASPFSSNDRATHDVAYLARLDRGDGRPLILIAGVHAVGSLGVATLLADPEQLRSLDAPTSGHRFSTVIGCTFDPDALTVSEATPLMAPSVHAE